MVSLIFEWSNAILLSPLMRNIYILYIHLRKQWMIEYLFNHNWKIIKITISEQVGIKSLRESFQF